MIVAAAYGMGTNSTAFLIEMVTRGEQIDVILAADTGGERKQTYEFSDLFSGWLQAHGYPPVTRVKKGGREETLEENCLRLNMLPSLSYGYKGCSHKYKIEAQEKYLNNWQPAKDAWQRGEKVIKLIGYDIDEPHRAAIPEDAKYRYRYPLLEWGWGREDCERRIIAAGLPLPGKSACFFCPSSTKPEILKLRDEHPDLLLRALRLEATAIEADNLKSIKGLGRRLSWSQFIVEHTMLEQEQKRTVIPIASVDDPVPCGCYDGTDD